MADWWDKYSAPAAAEQVASGNWWDKYAEPDDAPYFGDVNSGVSSSAPDPNASFLDSAWRANKAQMGPIFAGNVKRMAAEVSDPIAGLLNGTFGKPTAEDAPELSLTVNPNGNTSLPASPLIAPDAGMALMDAARAEPLRNATLRDLQQSGLAQARAGGAELQQARTDMEVPESGLERYAKLAAISAGPTLAGMTAGIVTKSPAIGAGVSTMFAVPSAYGEARDAGHSVEDAIKYAGVVGGAEVVSERLGFDALLGKLATRLPAGKLATVFGTLEKSIPGRALTGAGVEGTTEALSQAAQNAYKIAGLGEHMTFDEFMTDMKDSFGAGAMIGGPLAGSHAAAQSLAEQNDPEARIRRLAEEVIGSAPERIETPETQAVDAGRNAARAIFAEANISNDTGAVIPDPRAIDFSQQADLETGIAPVGVAPESMGDLDQQLAGLAPAPVAPTESAPIDQEALLADLAEPELIRGGSRVFYRGDVPSMRARLAEAGLSEGMRQTNEDGTDAGLYFPARMQAEVDAVLRRKPSEDSATEAPTNNATPERIAEVPIASLTLSDDVPQFKSGAREDGVVEPLGGKFDRRGTGPIQVWRRKDGRMEVISGRHRLDLARRSGETTIPAQVYDEAQGFDARQAASLDAELNIRDGQGKVKDYVQYFTQPAFDGPEGRQAADARGLLARATGKRAYSIASQGSSELIAAHSADRVTDEAAVQIAQAAPQNAPLQALGMKLVQEGKSIGIAANTMRAVRSMQGDRPQTSGDMFGFDDSAIQDAVKIAGVASRRQREIGERLAAITGAAKRPDIARREGVDVRDPQALPARIAQLRAEKAEWDDWATDPAKVDEIRAELGMEPQPEFARAEDPAEFVDDVTAPMFSRRTGGASGDMFGGATIEDTNRASQRSRMPEAADLFGGPSMQERVGAAERARDSARNSGDGKRADTGDGGLFDGPRPEQAILRSQRKQEDEDQRPDKPTDEGIESNEITGDDADALIADMRARQQSKLDEAADPLTEGFKILGANPETFRTKLLPGKTVRELAKQSGANYAGQSNEDGIAVHSVAVDQGAAGPATAKIYDDGNDVWIDVSGLKSGGGKGDAIYNMAYSYARNNGRNFKEDPAGVSDTAMYRRPVQQLSALLKSGNADNIAPGDFLATQRPGGPNTRPIKAPANRAFDPTLRENILTTYTNALNAVPEIGEIRYDTNRAAFVDASGKPVTDADFDRLASNRRANPIREAMVRVGDPETGQRLEPAPVGGNSLKVAVLAQTLLGASPSQRPALLDGLRKIAAGSLGDSGLSRILPSKNKAPADAGVSRSEPLTRAEIDADVKRVFGTAKPLTRLINSGAVSLITKAEAAALPKIVREAKREGVTPESLVAGSKGLHDGKQGYLITDELRPNEVAGVLLHEIGVHHTMERILGKPVFDRLQKAVESFAARGDKDVLKAQKAVPADTPAEHKAHETLAYLSEQSANHTLVERMTDGTKLFLNRIGIPMSWIKAEPAAIRKIARESLLAEARRGDGSVRYNGRDTLYQKVYHGTPHRDIEKTGFSLQKIGSGEGAQAYGWGMYFAGNKEIAEHYRKMLGGNHLADADGNRVDFSHLSYEAQKAIHENLAFGNDKADTLRTLDTSIENSESWDRQDASNGLSPRREKFIKAMREARMFIEPLDIRGDGGQLYHAEIPEDSDLLDWDKPLSEQPAKVKAALAPLIEQVRDTKRFSDDPTGERIYNALSVRLAEGEAPGKLGRGAKAASEALLRAGIPGLRYLDGNSRGKGDGSHNYVIWDETLLTPEKAQITPYYSKRADDEDQTQTAAFKRWFAGSKVVDSEGKPLVVYHGTTGDFDAFDLGYSGSDGVGYSAPAIFAASDPAIASDYATNKLNREIADAYREVQKIKNENPGDYGAAYEAAYDKVKAAFADVKRTGRRETGDGANVMPVYMSLQTPLVIDGKGARFMQVMPDAIARAVSGKHDGLIVNNVIDHASPSSEYPTQILVAFNPNQIKSATGNRGTFDPSDPNIMYSRRTPADAERKADDHGTTQPVATKRIPNRSSAYGHYEHYTIGRSVENVPLSELISTYARPARVRELAELIRQSGKVDPIIVGVSLDGTTEVIEGQHRVAALKQLGAQKVPALIVRETRPQYAVSAMRGKYIVHPEGHTNADDIVSMHESVDAAWGEADRLNGEQANVKFSRRTRAAAEAEADVLRNDARNTLGGPTTGGAIGWNFDAGEWEGKSGTARRARAALDDKMIAWRDVQDSIAEHLGNTVPDAQNVYRLENLMHGRVKEGIDALEEKQVVPLVKAMQEAKITPAMLEEYLYALHAKERNAQIAKINPKMPDGGSGMTNAEADAILAKPLPNGMKSIAKRAQNLVRQTRKRLLDHGIITQDQFDAMESQYQNYVPLRGKTVGENEFDSGGSGAGRGIDGRPSPVKQAFGRGAGNRAENILGEIIGDAKRGIIAAEHARVGRAVMRIVLANPNPKLWTVEPVLTERKLDSTGEVYEAVVQDWSDPSIVAVRHRGQIYKVQINHAPLAKALNLVGVDQIGAVTRAAGAVNRYFSAVLTRYNPAFIPVNATRDALFGLTGLAVEHGELTAMKAALYYPKAIRAAWREARRLPPKSQADTYAREFAEDGGKTGYVSMPSVEELQRKIGNGKFGGYSPQGIGRAAQAVGDLVGAMNDSVENALRLSAYVTLREQGMAREKAASYAKELTVNFNRKGSEGSKLNSWFLFYNASMQGIKRTGALMKSPKTWGYLGALTAAQIAAVMYAMGQEDDEGTPIWDKVPDHVKQRNIVFTWLDDEGDQKILTIPMPYGFNVFPYLAGRVADGMMHAENRPRDRAMSIAADTVSTAVQSFSPVPLDDGAMGLLPTALRIPLSIQVNRDDFGRQIRKENPFGKFDVPRASMGKPDTLELFKLAATGLNRIGGGDDRTPPPMSAFDVAPEDIEYVLEKLGGGTGKFIIDMATLGQKAAGELPVEARDVPIAKRFFTNVNEPAAQQAMFYDRRDALERNADLVRDTYEKDGPEAAIALLKATPSLSGADFRRYKRADPKAGHKKGGIVVVDGRPQLVVRRPDSVYGRYKEAEAETTEVNEAMRNAYTDAPVSLIPNRERDSRLKELADRRMEAQKAFNAVWNRDVVGGE